MKLMTHATLKPGFQAGRLRELAEELKVCGCELKLRLSEQRLYMGFPEECERWIVAGGLQHLLSAYADTLSWTPRFHEQHDVQRMPDATGGGNRPRTDSR